MSKEIIGKLESLANQLEKFSQEDKQSAQIPNISDHLKGIYEGQARAWKFCAKWLREQVKNKT